MTEAEGAVRDGLHAQLEAGLDEAVVLLGQQRELDLAVLILLVLLVMVLSLL